MGISNRYILAVRDSLLAAVAAFLGPPVSSVLWSPHLSIANAIDGLFGMRTEEWAILLLLLVSPAALLGSLADFVVRCHRGRGTHAVAAATGTALGASLLAHGAFYWWLSNVL